MRDYYEGMFKLAGPPGNHNNRVLIVVVEFNVVVRAHSREAPIRRELNEPYR